MSFFSCQQLKTSAMDLPNIFRQFFGFHKFNNDDTFNHGEADDRNVNDDLFMDSAFSEIHTFFEKHMHGIFGKFEIPGTESLFGSDSFPFESPGRQELDLNEHYSLLKPGYESSSKENNEKVDTDLDRDVKKGKLNDFFHHKDNEPSAESPKKFYSKSVITRTIISDGKCVTKKTVTDQDGNVETTITHSESKPNTDDSEFHDRPNKLFPFKFF